MIAVIFEVTPRKKRMNDYLEAAASLKPLLADFDGFLSIERFESLVNPGKILSLSYWRDEESVARWRNMEAHRAHQTLGRSVVFEDYTLRVAAVIRDYGMTSREEAPTDSRAAHGA